MPQELNGLDLMNIAKCVSDTITSCKDPQVISIQVIDKRDDGYLHTQVIYGNSDIVADYEKAMKQYGKEMIAALERDTD